VGFLQRPYDELVTQIWPALREKLASAIAQRTRAELDEIFEGTDACFTSVLSMDEAKEHPHNKARGTFIEVGGVTQPAPVPRFSRSQSQHPRPPRPPGADTRAVLAELGYSDEQINRWIESGLAG
jgi:alpha-methylacyl-CoA racemase